MSKIVIALMLLVNVALAQINLVPNGGFELYSSCPTGNDNITEATGWLRFRSSPDYYNACAPSGGLSVPNSNIGFQQSHSGNGMAAIVTFDGTALNYREVIGYQLQQPLIVGQKYYLKLNINKSPNGPNNVLSINTDKIGVNFSNIQYTNLNPAPVTNSALIYADTIITDAMGWYKLQGSFIATQSYQYLMIGNFFDDGHTDTSGTTTLGSLSYYFIDDVCLSTDSVYCSVFTKIDSHSDFTPIYLINEIEHKKLTIRAVYPNTNYDVSIYNTNAQVVFKKTNLFSEFQLSTKEFKRGLYFVEIHFGKNKLSKKILLTN